MGFFFLRKSRFLFMNIDPSVASPALGKAHEVLRFPPTAPRRPGLIPRCSFAEHAAFRSLGFRFNSALGWRSLSEPRRAVRPGKKPEPPPAPHSPAALSSASPPSQPRGLVLGLLLAPNYCIFLYFGGGVLCGAASPFPAFGERFL